MLSWSVQAALTHHQQAGGFINTGLGGSPRPRPLQIWFLVRAPFLVHRWLSSLSGLTWWKRGAALGCLL